MFAMCPGHVFKELSQSKQLSIVFKQDFGAPAPATPIAEHSESRAFEAVSAQAPLISRSFTSSA